MADILFCNLCNQSVTVSDLDAGTALRLGDRSLCPACQDLLGARTHAKSAAGPLVFLMSILGVVGVLFLGYHGYRGQEAFRGETQVAFESHAADAREEVKGKLADLKKELHEDLALLRTMGTANATNRGRLQADVHKDLKRLEDDIARLDAILTEQDAISKRLERSEATLSVVDQRQRESRRTMEKLRDEVELLSTQLRIAAQRGPASSTEASVFSPQITGLLKLLQSTDKDERLDALNKIAPQADLRLVSHLLPLLSDPYEFNRFYAAKALGEWSAKDAAPHLIETLLDEISFVRQAALQSLHKLTGQNFRFDHQLDPSDPKNQTAYGSWKTWWSANGKNFLEG